MVKKGTKYPDPPHNPYEEHDGLRQAYAEGFKFGFDLAEAITGPCWLPVTERTLPKEGLPVIVLGKEGDWQNRVYLGHHDDDVHLWRWRNHTYKEVYWWMYKASALPDPRKEKED